MGKIKDKAKAAAAYIASNIQDTVSEGTIKPLPKTLSELKKEADSLGLLKPGIRELDTPRKLLLKAIWDSHGIGRSIQQASILLVGASGVGKSSTINHTFDLKENSIAFAKTNDTESETRITTEYVIKSDYEKYGVKEVTLGIVDSPGFNDTEGVKQDACNFYSIKNFYSTHPNFGHSVPNLIFVLVQATDNRVKGTNSILSKSLRCLKSLNLVDTKHPNVVGILTHCCYIRNWEKDMPKKKEILSQCIFQFLNVKAPIVTLENDVELLETDGDYTVLPNGERQVKNLYDSCVKLLEDSGDPLGHIILNACFLKSKKPTIGHKVEAKDANKTKLSNDEQQFFMEFEKTASGGIIDPLVKEAEEFSEKNHLNAEAYADIQNLVKKMMELGIEELEDLKYFRTGSFSLENTLTSNCKAFLSNLKVESRSVAINNYKILGQGYNILMDKIMPNQILDLEMIDSGYGYDIPSMATFDRTNESQSFMAVFENKEAMFEFRKDCLNIEVQVDYDLVSLTARPGTFVGRSEYSSLKENRLFKLTMPNFLEEKVDSQFTKEFVDDVNELPNVYEVYDKVNRKCYEEFFAKWGHYRIVSAYGGGSVELKINPQNIHNIVFDEVQEILTLYNTGTVSHLNPQQENKRKEILRASKTTWLGGSKDLRTKRTLEAPNLMKEWNLSLMANPTMMETDMTLEPITAAIGFLQREKQIPSHTALIDILRGDFKKYTEKERKLEEERLQKIADERTEQERKDIAAKAERDRQEAAAEVERAEKKRNLEEERLKKKADEMAEQERKNIAAKAEQDRLDAAAKAANTRAGAIKDPKPKKSGRCSIL